MALAGIARAGDPEIFDPPAAQAERYRSVWEKAPFAAWAPAASPPQGASLSQRFVLAGMATLNDEPLIFVLDRQSLARIVVTKKGDASGLRLVSVDSNSDPKQASATVRLGAEQDVIHYDLATLQSVTQSADQAAAKNSGGAPPIAPNPDTQAQVLPAAGPPRNTRVIKKPISFKPR